MNIQDIKEVMPKLYNMERKENQQFIHLEAEKYIQRMKLKLIDRYLTYFQQQYDLV